MTSRRPRLQWLPPLLVGASATVAAEVAVAVLLYDGPGFVRSLTTILAVEGLALAGGIWSAPGTDDGLVDALRTRWLLCLLAFLAATLFGTAWSLVPTLGETRAGQGAGLALLGAAPLFTAGSVVAGISTIVAADAGGRLRMPWAAAAVGAALGFVLTGTLLPRAPMPASLLVSCLVMLSLAGMVFGGVLGGRTEVEVRATRPGRPHDVRLEERRRPMDDVAVRELREGPFLRRHGPLTDEGDPPWDVAVARALMPGQEAEWRVLVVGGGASAAVRAILREHPLATIDVVERTGAVVELGREHFGTELSIARDERVAVAVGNLEDGLGGLAYGYHLVMVDTAALAPLGGASGLSSFARGAIFRAVTPGGVVAWGPVGDEPSDHALPDGWARTVLVRRATNAWPEAETVVLAARSASLDRLPVPVDFDVAEGARPVSVSPTGIP